MCKQTGWFTQLLNFGNNNSNRNNSYNTNPALNNRNYYQTPQNPSSYGYDNYNSYNENNLKNQSNIRSINSSENSINSQQQCATIDTVTVLFEDRTLPIVKADVIHALLILHQLTHNMINTSFFICEYKSSSQSNVVFSKSVKFTIELEIQFNHNNPQKKQLHQQMLQNLPNHRNIGDVCVHFKMLNGTTRRFRKIVQVLYAHICNGPTQQQFLKDLANITQDPNQSSNQNNNNNNSTS